MKVIKNENETIIYPMLSQTDTEFDDDFFILVGNTCTMINSQIIDEDDLQKIVEGLKKAIEIISTTYSAMCQDCGHSVSIEHVAGCLNHPVLGLVKKQ